MLDKAKLSSKLKEVVKHSFDSISQERFVAERLWQEAIKDETLFDRAKNANGSLNLSFWEGSLGAKYAIEIKNDHYTLVAVDGSQIYPDRHQGTDCFLINVSEVILHYGQGRSGAKIESFPYVFSSDSEFDSDELVDCKRQELEFKHGLEVAKRVKSKTKNSVLLLFDGSLIFWHLQSKGEAIKKHFLKSYIQILNQCFENGIFFASYISLPKSKDLISILRFQAQNKNLFKFLTDSNIADLFLQENECSNLFYSGAEIVKNYPDQLKTAFFYSKIKDEIVRIEIPVFVKPNLNFIKTTIFDQAQKGNGYPVGLSEAHEQAVVKNQERELFYTMIKSSKAFSKSILSRKMNSKNRPCI